MLTFHFELISSPIIR